MNKENSYRKERIETDEQTIDIVVKDNAVLIEIENGSIIYAGSNWIRLNWKDWNEVIRVVRRLKSDMGNKINKEFVREKKIKGLRNHREEINVRLIDRLIEIEDLIIKNEEVNCVGSIFLYEEEWEKLKKCVNELIEEVE